MQGFESGSWKMSADVDRCRQMSAYVSLSREVPNLSLHRLSGPVMFGHEANDSASKPAAGDLSFNKF